MTTLQSQFWMHYNLLNTQLVSGTNRELQESNLLLTKTFARTNGFKVEKGMNSIKVFSIDSGRLD